MLHTRGDTLIASGAYATSISYPLLLDNIDILAISATYSNATTGAKTFASGIVEVDTITFAAKGSTTNGDYFVVHDYLGGSWAVGLDTLGTGAATPTGAAWVAIPAANKVYTNISSATTGAQVEVLVATAINALTGFTAVITTGNSTADMSCTNKYAGVVVAPTVYSRAGAAGTGSITAAVTTAGTASKVNPVTNYVTITGHGQVTGSLGRMTTSSALPGGITNSSTDLFIIKIDANTVQFADSLAHAVAGTAITLTSSGVGTQTFTPTTSSGNILKLQAGNDGTNFADISGDTVTISTTSGATTVWDLGRPSYRYVNVLYTPSAGQINLNVILNGKSDK